MRYHCPQNEIENEHFLYRLLKELYDQTWLLEGDYNSEFLLVPWSSASIGGEVSQIILFLDVDPCGWCFAKNMFFLMIDLLFCFWSYLEKTRCNPLFIMKIFWTSGPVVFNGQSWRSFPRCKLGGCMFVFVCSIRFIWCFLLYLLHKKENHFILLWSIYRPDLVSVPSASSSEKRNSKKCRKMKRKLWAIREFS